MIHILIIKNNNHSSSYVNIILGIPFTIGYSLLHYGLGHTKTPSIICVYERIILNNYFK